MQNLYFDYLKPESHGRLASKIHCFEAPFQVKPIRRTFSICIRAKQVLQHRRVQAAAHHQDLHRRLVGLHLLYVSPHLLLLGLNRVCKSRCGVLATVSNRYGINCWKGGTANYHVF